MRNISRVLMTAGVAIGLCLATANAGAQGGGGGFGGGGGNNGGGGGGGGFGGGGRGGGRQNMDPAQIQQMVLDSLREQLEVPDDSEWKVLAAQLQKVIEAQTQMGSGGFNLMAMAFRRGGGGGPGGNNNNNNNGNRRGGALPFGMGAQSAEEQALQRAIDLKASSAELKAAITRLQESRKRKQETLDKAHADLAQLLSARQEAICYSLGLL